MELNEKIFKWLNPDGCWHKRLECETCAPYPCKYCKEGHRFEENPDYTTDPAAMLELIEAVREKGFELEAYSEPKQPYLVCIAESPSGKNELRQEADTLPMAVAMAVGKLIDAAT